MGENFSPKLARVKADVQRAKDVAVGLVSAPEYPLQQINFNRIRSVGTSFWPKPHIPRTE